MEREGKQHRRTPGFTKLYEQLSPELRLEAFRAYRKMLSAPERVNLKFVGTYNGLPQYSARVNLNVRALAVRDGSTYVWYWIGDHTDYDRLLKSLRK